jgi:hypothetical protein
VRGSRTRSAGRRPKTHRFQLSTRPSWELLLPTGGPFARGGRIGSMDRILELGRLGIVSAEHHTGPRLHKGWMYYNPSEARTWYYPCIFEPAAHSALRLFLSWKEDAQQPDCQSQQSSMAIANPHQQITPPQTLNRSLRFFFPDFMRRINKCQVARVL